jgi:HK97 family phage major capsid protein
MNKKKLLEERAELYNQCKAIEALAAEDAREMTADERTMIENHLQRIDDLDGQIALAERIADKAAEISNGGDRGGKLDVKVINEPQQQDPRRGFSDIRDMFESVVNGAKTGQVDNRLKPLAAVGSDEHSTFADPFGGFLIPEQLMPGVMEVAPEADPTAGLVTQIRMNVPTVKINARVDKNHSSSVSGGLTVARESETGTGTSSRQKYEQVTLDAHDIVGVAYISDRLIESSPSSIVDLINAGFAQEFASKQLDEKLTGTGASEPEGILNADCLVTVAKETNQTADTINGDNLVKMRARSYNFGNSIWMANHDTYPQLAKAHLGGTNSDSQLYQHSLVGDRPDTLLGRPIVYSEYCETLGDKGDIYLCDWSQYLWGTLVGGLRSRESMHVRFLERERTLQVYTCNDGRAWWSAALTPVNGSNTLSPFVTLAARA